MKALYKKFLECGAVSTDSRKITPGSLFFGLKGPNFDGNKYAADALKKGARYAVVDDTSHVLDDCYLPVTNTLQSLQELARHHRDQLNIPVIAIAGSNGKTTTKELMKAALSSSYNTFATQGNLNNEIGVPLSLLSLTTKTQMAVIEMGARFKGDIEVLCKIANPSHGLITNNGKDHLETFKTLENTLRTNAELYEYLAANDGTAFVNTKHEDLMEAASIVKKSVTYGPAESGAEYEGGISSLFPYLKVSCNGTEIQSQLTGKYNLENIMAAVAVGRHFKVSMEDIRTAIEAYVPSNNRSQILRQDSNVFIMDAYNANPTSMSEALENLAEIQAPNKVAILGDMLELGTASYEEHKGIVQRLKQMRLTRVVLVGSEFGKLQNELDCLHFNHVAEAREWFAQQQFENTTFLLKGSRGISLEKILEAALS